MITRTFSILIPTVLMVFVLLADQEAYAVTFLDHTGYIPTWASTMGQSQALSVCSNSVQYGTADFNWCGEFAGYTVDQSTGRTSVTFLDHTGYIPTWASTMGQSQALSVCSNSVQYGTADFNWCGEFAGYTVDQSHIMQGNTQLQSSPQIITSMFSASQFYDSSNSYRDNIHNFSITPPANWVSKNTTGDVLASFWNGNSKHPAFLNISEVGNGKSIDFGSMTDQQILDTFIASFTSSYPSMHYEIYQKSLYHYSDGIKIVVTVTTTPDQGSSTKGEIITYWLKNGGEYLVAYGTILDDFDTYLSDAQKSIDTFYISSTQYASSQQSTVPEFGTLASIVFVMGIILTIVLSTKVRQKI